MNAPLRSPGSVDLLSDPSRSPMQRLREKVAENRRDIEHRQDFASLFHSAAFLRSLISFRAQSSFNFRTFLHADRHTIYRDNSRFVARVEFFQIRCSFASSKRFFIATKGNRMISPLSESARGRRRFVLLSLRIFQRFRALRIVKGSLQHFFEELTERRCDVNF